MAKKICGYLMDKETGGLIGVNFFGLLIADLYQKGKDIDEITEICRNQTASSSEIKLLVVEFIRQMEQKNLTRDRVRVIPKNEEFHLLTLQLDLSWDCNLECRHCYLDDTHLIEKSLNKEEWQRVIDQAYEMGVPKITFLGGEPVLSPYFFDLAQYANMMGFKMYTTTNGTLITPEIACGFVKVGFNEIDVSIDGASQETHEFLRGKGTFKKTIHGIICMVSSGLSVKSATVLHKGNFSEVGELLILGHDLGLKQMYFNLFLPGGVGKKIWKNYELSFEEWLQIKEVIHHWNRSNKELKAFAENRFDFGEISTVADYQIDSCDYAGCKAGKRELLITPDGYGVACPLLSTERKFHKMNIRQYSLWEIWQQDEWVVKLRQVNEITLQGKCQKCPSIMVCKGGCHILSLFECGDINQPDPRCPH